MRTYRGERWGPSGGDVRVTVQDGAGPVRALAHVKVHSSGFEFGYGGSGPADLALSLLVDHFGETPGRVQRAAKTGVPASRAWALHQSFKHAFVEVAPRAGFVVTSTEIDVWLLMIGEVVRR